MPSQNEDLVRRTLEAWKKKELGVVLACAHPEIELDWSASVGPLQGMYHGHAGMARFWDLLWDAFEEFAPLIEACIECGDDRLITDNLIRARGKASGIDVTSRGATLWTFRDGKIAGEKLFQSLDEALAAVGLTADAS
jgi:ketosteroid isomerase-like protein